MKRLSINRQQFSELFWSIVSAHEEYVGNEIWSGFSDYLDSLESNREHATYNTGSIGIHTAYWLALLCRYFAPIVVAEVGTFIGKSTYSISKGIENSQGAEIHTCDNSNNIVLNLATRTRCVQYPLKTATNMLEALVSLNKNVDLFFIDGRLSSKDIDLMAHLSTTNSVIVLDDFEGVEKGVMNATNILSNSHFKKYLLVYPPCAPPIRFLNVKSNTRLALLLPISVINFTAQ